MRHLSARLFAAALLLLSFSAAATQLAPSSSPPQRKTTTVINMAAAHERPRYFFRTGFPKSATDYYAAVANELSVAPVVFNGSTLSSVVSFLGYLGLLVDQDPCTLMAKGTAGQVLAVRYFAPKTSSLQTTLVPSEFGWRQIIRLNAASQSDAEKAGIKAAYILLNYQQLPSELATDPFSVPPAYTQVMLIRTSASIKAGGAKPAYWLLYTGTGPRATHIYATFAGGDVATKGQPYHVPEACGQCHGGDEDRASLNFFDIDQWHDRVGSGDDFAAVDLSSPRSWVETGACAIPLSVVRTLNEEVLAHNREINAEAFVINAVQSWLNKHPANGSLLATVERGFGNNTWDMTRQGDSELIKQLDRYCYRCHGSVVFNVYDREAVLAKRSRLIPMIQDGEMPLDRAVTPLSTKERTRLIDMLTNAK